MNKEIVGPHMIRLPRPAFLSFIYDMIPVCLAWLVKTEQMEAADSTDLDWVTDGSKAGWTT